MNDVLNQEEIDDLLGNNEQSAEAAGPKHYDFSENVGMARDKFHKLEMIYEKFERSFKISLYQCFKSNVDIKADPIRIMKANDFISSIQSPANINIINIKPLKGDAFLWLNSKLIYGMVDKYFGGEGKTEGVETQSNFTPTEYRIIKKVLELIFQEMEIAWAETHTVQFELIKQETDPTLLNTVLPFEHVLLKDFHIEFQEGGGELQLAIPLNILEPIKQKLEFNPMNPEVVADQQWGESLRKEILEAQINLSCILASKKMKLGEIKKFKAGDIISIDIPEHSTIKISNISVYDAKFGTHEGHYAVKINSRLK